MDIDKMVEEFTNQLKEQKATVVELEKQLKSRNEQVLRLEGAIEALQLTQKEPETDDSKE
jgi:septal ring factor EnvC (AmiA/AmiB activator)|tara:strand:+ start:417 stop:596 length:180 start_codon:yes stop_codon:yes gene_type:complete